MSTPSQKPARARALVAEDSAVQLCELEMLLEQSNIEIVGAAATTASLRELIKTQYPDIAILDVNLNGELVFPLADVLIEHGVPVIFVTGYPLEETLPPRLLDLPILQKPCNPDDLIRAIDGAVYDARARTEREWQELGQSL